MVDDSTRALIERARRGDRAAFEELTTRYSPRIDALIRLRLGSDLATKVEVEDVAQETMIKAFTSIETLRAEDERSFFAWLASIAHNVVLELARHHRRRPSVAYDDDKVTSDPSPSRGLQRSERFDRLQEALDSLSPDHREVILLARIEGLPVVEVARRMGRTVGAIGQLLWRALKKLREQFGDTQSFHLPAKRLDDQRKTDGQ